MRRYFPILPVLFLIILACMAGKPHRAAAAETALGQAVRALQEGKGGYGLSLVSRSGDPLAKDVYLWLYMMQRPQDFDFNEIAAFLHKHNSWPSRDGIQRAAEKHLPFQDTAALQSFYAERDPVSAEGMLAYIRLHQQTGQTARIEKVLGPWWIKTLLKPEDQRAVYQAYAFKLPFTYHAQRLNTLLTNEYETTAATLAAAMGTGYPQLVQARLGLMKGAGNVDGLVRNVPVALQNDPGLLLDRITYRRKADANDAAIDLLNRQPQLTEHDNPEGWWKERQVMIRRMLEIRKYDKAYALASKHGMPTDGEKAEGEWLAGWISLRFLDEPTRGFGHFKTMFESVKSPISKARGAYWAGRAAKAAGQEQVAQAWLQVAAKRPQTYYGQLANKMLAPNLRVAIPAKINVPSNLVAQVRGSNLGKAASYLLAANRPAEAWQFMKAIAEQSETAEQYGALAAFASEQGLKTQALRIAKRAAQEDGFYLPQYAYPDLNKKPDTGGVDADLVRAVIRQESEYDPNAQSPVGARGLMQLMPATAKQTASKLGIPHDTAMLTAQPYHNVRLGSAYLGQLMSRFDNSLPLVLASYNAGSGRTLKWMALHGDPRSDRVDWVDWVELIPFTETRNYVQRVIEGYEIYRARD